MADLEFSEEKIDVGEVSLVVLRAGSGPPLLVLHEELGCPGPVAWQAELAERRTLLIPQHPGFGRGSGGEWIASVRDLACFYNRYLREQGLGPVDALGFSFGGWVAAEMAASDPGLLRRMVLVAPQGIRPPQGEILDMFMLTAENYFGRSVRDPAATEEYPALYGSEVTPEQFEAWEDARAQIARLAWRPYMFNPSLPQLLGAVSVPTLLLWGEQDAIVPPSAGDAYRRALPDARLVVFPDCGHRPEVEVRDAFLRELGDFLG